ncbi:hypothetical protein [Boudabousia marimammalium]|uniref:Uncharacterized protein n=1 Tax=Boudabousia marimammalium TaxID=156892 RepID=A0A1Q5PNZ0_9ACTO|nr:hypothetical protein [Boudabousia marimammalium]OKL49308.1 hypothetical protein BM477_04830 [Boudabousia marimammalium]
MGWFGRSSSKNVAGSEPKNSQMPAALAALVPEGQAQSAQTTAAGKWVVVNSAGVHLVGEVLEESVPWYMIERMTFAGKQRELKLWWTNRSVEPVALQLLDRDPREFMDTAQDHLEHSLVMVRQRQVEGGSITGTIRRDEAGELFIVISTSSEKVRVEDSVLDDFERELRDLAGIQDAE